MSDTGEPAASESGAWATDAPSEERRAADARAHIVARTHEIRDREVSRALRRFDAVGEFTDEQEAAVRTLADRIVADLVTVPLDALGESRDSARLEAALDLFTPTDAERR